MFYFKLLIKATNKIIIKKFFSYYLAENFLRKIKYSKKIYILDTNFLLK